MNAITTILELGNSKHCFLERTASYQYGSKNLPSPRDDGISVYEVKTGDNRTAYFSTPGGSAELVSGDTVQINGLYGEKLGLHHGDPLMLKRIKSTLSTARKVKVEPLSTDDWEILEQNCGRVETSLLDQIRVIWPDQVFPMWIQKSVCIFLKTTSVEPMSYCLLLENNTEIMVAPKSRTYNPPKSLGLRGTPYTPFSRLAGQTMSPPPIHMRSPTPSLPSATPTKGKCLFQEEDKSSSHENLDTLEPRPVLRSPSRSPRSTLKRSMNRQRGSLSDPFIEQQGKQSGYPRPMLRRQSSLMESVMKYVFSFMEKKDDFDTRSESDSSSGIDFSSQNLPPRSGVFRVQPMKLSSSIEECNPLLSSLTTKGLSPSSSMSSRNDFNTKTVPNLPYELFQPSTVYIDANSTKLERELHPYLPRLPNNFIARLQRLPSPQEKAEAVQKGAKKTTKDGQDKNLLSSGPASTSSRKSMDESSNSRSSSVSSAADQDGDCKINASCYVRVVVIDRKAALTDEAWKDAADVLLSQQPLMIGHLIIPDLLRRQLKLDATGSVWLQTGTIDIVIPKKVVVHPLASLPYGVSIEMLEKAFRAYIKLCADAEHPLILFQGLFVRCPIFLGLTVEVQLTFFGENDLANPKAVSMLSEQNIDSVLVNVERSMKMDKMGVVNQTLVYTRTSDFDPQPPIVKLKHLGGTEKVAKTGLAYLQACVGSRPLGQETFRHRRGLCNGSLLITGSRGSGKSSLAMALCRKMSQIPTMAYISLVNCKSLRGKTVAHIQKFLESVFDEAAWREPSIIVFDNLDVIMPAATGPEGEMNVEALYAAKNSQVLQGLIKYEMENNSRLAIITTAASKNSLHPTLVSHSGVHYFQVTLNIGSPDKGVREKILTCLLQLHSSVSNETLKTVDLRPIASTTEGYVARDLEMLVNRAIHNRLICDRDAHLGKITLTQEDFEMAQDKFKPVSIRGLDLHKAGDLGWKDVGGLDDVKKALVETLRWPAKYPRLFASCPLRLRSGILLYGAPGTGKTLLAGVVAKECGLNFISIKGPELLSKYIGASEQAVRDLFIRATSAKPCILFFDEFDSIAPKRGHDSTGVTDRVVNQLLTQLDGVEGLEGVYVLAATSRPDLIDSALLRPGRLDKSLQCCIPTEDDRYHILEALTTKMCLGIDVELMEIAKMCPFFTGADLKALLYNAQLKAIHENANMELVMDESVLRIKGDDDHCPAVKQATQLFKEDFNTKLTIAREKSLSEKNSPTKSVDAINYDRKASGTSDESATSGEVTTENKFASSMSQENSEKLLKNLNNWMNNSEDCAGDDEENILSMKISEDLLKADGSGVIDHDTVLKESKNAITRAAIQSVGFDVDGFLSNPELEADGDDEGFDNKDGALSPVSEQSKSSSSDRSWVPLTSSPIRQPSGDGEGGGFTSFFLPEAPENEMMAGEKGDDEVDNKNIWEENDSKIDLPSFRYDKIQNGDDEDVDGIDEMVINKARVHNSSENKIKVSSSMNLPDPSLTYPPHSNRRRSYERTQSHPAETLDVTDSRMKFLTVESNLVQKPVTVFTSLEHGLATLSPEDEARYLSMVLEIRQRDDRLFEAANNKRRTSLMVTKASSALVEVCQRHLLEAAQEMKPSVTVAERKKYDTIYNKFVASRAADSGRDRVDSALQQKRATLA